MSNAPDPVTVVIASPLEPELVERLRAIDPARLRVVHEPDLIPTPRFPSDHIGRPPSLDADGIARWLSILRSADVLLDVDWYAPDALRANAPGLRWIQSSQSGVGRRVRELGLDHGHVIVTTAAGVHAVPLAEFAVLGLLYLVRDVPRMQAEQARRSWDRIVSRTLAGRRVLLVGLGAIGRETARVLAALGVEVWGMRRSDGPAPTGVGRLVGRDELLASLAAVDALVVALPDTSDTRHLIGAAELAALPDGAFVVNVGRGRVIDEAALVAALGRGHLGGAALDVFETEPLPADSPLWTMPNVLVSPHRASIVEAENGLIVDLFADNLQRFLDGRPLRNVYEPDRGY